MSPKYKVIPDRDYMLWQLPSLTSATGMGYVICACDGKGFIIDGGGEENKDLVLSFIREKCACEVAAWFITHPHPGHVGALCAILEDMPQDICISKIIHSPLSIEDVDKYEKESLPFIRRWTSALRKFHGGKKVSITSDVRLKFGKTVVRVICCGSRAEHKNNFVNNSGLLYKFEMFCSSALFLGDIGREASISILESKDKKSMLDCDIIQIANHGKSTVLSEIYYIASPNTCLWSTPPEECHSDGQYDELRSILQLSGAAEHYYFDGADVDDIPEIKIVY